MANEQHLKQLNQAIEKHDISIWNRWRQEHPDVKPDLSGSDLRRADLSEANLSEANLSKADFSRSFLLGALLLGADLNRANLEDGVKSLSLSQIKKAKNWQTAYLARGILEELGLPVDHNEILRKETVKKPSNT